MTPNNKRKKEETVAAVIASVNGTGSDGKRQCTAQSTTTGDTSGIVSVEQEPPGEATQQQPAVGTVSQTNNQNNDDNDDGLPTSIKLSKHLCRIVDTDHFSLKEAIGTLQKLYRWLDTEDENFLKYFYSYGGVIKVLDFLTVTMNDAKCKGKTRSRCIGLSAMQLLERFRHYKQ